MARVSQVKSEILRVLEKRHSPISATEILKTVKVNKTSVYRQIDSLVAESKIVVVDLGDGMKRYEMAGYHHHHLMCKNCGTIEEIEPKEIEVLLSKLEKKLKFKNVGHNLEFFGVCNNCP